MNTFPSFVDDEAAPKPSEGELFPVAFDFIREQAPTLNPEVAKRLAHNIARGFSRALANGGQTCEALDDPLLRLNRHWVWPELERAVPYTLEDAPQVSWEVWSREQWYAKWQAEDGAKRIEEMTAELWYWNVPMTEVRRWRDELLPEVAKRGSKVYFLLLLKRHPRFQEVLQRSLEAWRAERQAEVDALRRKSEEPPVALHLDWLTRLVTTRLHAWVAFTRSPRGPEAFARVRDRLLSMAAEMAPAIPQEEIDAELKKALAWYGERSPTFNAAGAFAYAQERLSTLRTQLSEQAIQQRLAQYEPAVLVANSECVACAEKQQRLRAVTDVSELAPHHLFCTCGDFTWVARETRTMHDWKFRATLEFHIDAWAFSRLLGSRDCLLDAGALLMREHSIALDARLAAV